MYGKDFINCVFLKIKKEEVKNMANEKKIKIVIDSKKMHRGCPQGKLNNDHGTPGPKCK